MVRVKGENEIRCETHIQKVLRVQRGRLTALRAEGYGRLSAAGYVRFAQGATAPTALRVVDCRRAARLIKSALRDWLSVSYGMIGTLVISRCAASPYPAAPDFPPSGGQNKTLYAFL